MAQALEQLTANEREEMIFAVLRERFCLRCGKSVIAMRSNEREYYTRVCGCSP